MHGRPKTVNGPAVDLIAPVLEHPALAAGFVWANWVAFPSVSIYDAEEAQVYVLDVLEHDASVVPEVVRLLEILPGSSPLPYRAYGLMRPQYQVDDNAAPTMRAFKRTCRGCAS
jgi:hypothetical protein